jgi:radical SAM protein with 4Fe4S-binding SPASM domain
VKEGNLKELYIELSNKCPLECKHCSTKASPEGVRFIEQNLLQNLLFEGRGMGAEKLTLSGGEPFFSPGIWELLSFAKKLGYSVKIYSSGVLSDGEKLLAIDEFTLQKIVHYVERIIFSLHGASADVHDYITGKPGSFELLMESIQRVVESGLPCEVHVVPMSINYRHIPYVVELAEGLGIKQVSFLRLVLQGRCVEHKELLMNKAQVIEFINIIENLSSSLLNVRKGAPYRCLFFEESNLCSAGKNKLLIGPDGSVHPCESFKSDVATSNIKEKSLEEIWKTDKRINAIRKLHLKDIGVCNRCKYSKQCRGGCPGQRWLEHGKVDQGPDPLCQVNEGTSGIEEGKRGIEILACDIPKLGRRLSCTVST